MKYPASLFIPLLMLADYYLTIAGAILNDKKYAKHIVSDHYELNPRFQKEVKEKKLFCLRHLRSTFFYSIAIILCLEFLEAPPGCFEGILGAILTIYGTIVGRHLANIFIFRYYIKKPDEISGSAVFSHMGLLYMSMYYEWMVFIPLCLLTVLVPSPYLVGGLVGTILMVMIHYRWVRIYKKKNKECKSNTATCPQEEAVLSKEES